MSDATTVPLPVNAVMFQYFHWYARDDGGLWNELRDRAGELKERGITAVWIPPCYKGADGPKDVGYAVYDLYDLGEFDQKGSVRTKYGTKDELLGAINACHEVGLEVYADIVLNHRAGADETEEVTAVEVDKTDRTKPNSAPYQMHSWTKFTFPGRGETYSSFKWNASCFTSVDVNADAPGEDKLYLLNGKHFSEGVSDEFGNFDHLMGCDVDEQSPAVREELFRWGRWLLDTTHVDGFRVDAVKHMPAEFFRDFFNHAAEHLGRDLLCIGEYWSGELPDLEKYLSQAGPIMKLFDAPLHFKFVKTAKEGAAGDLRTIFDNSLVQAHPELAVTFVENHDTQPGQALQSPIEDWFKPLAYALILLRKEGYPCIFYGDYFGYEGPENEKEHSLVSHRQLIDAMLVARTRWQFGDQHDSFDDPHCIAWVRTGNEQHPGSLIVVMSNADSPPKRLNAYAKNGVFKDLTGHHGDQEIKTDEEGWAEFDCPAGKLSVWVQA